MNWQNDALCRPGSDIDPELFWVTGDERSNDPATLAQIAEAKATCWACPVASACLADAYESGEYEGIRGGMTGAERQDSRRRSIERTLPAAEVLTPAVTAITEDDPEAQFEVKTDWEIRQQSMTPDDLAQYRAVRSSAKTRERRNRRAQAEVAS
jgi:hypothetical protein